MVKVGELMEAWEVINEVKDYHDFEFKLRMFLEHFYYREGIREKLVEKEPIVNENEIMNNMLAACVEEMCFRAGVKRPEWLIKKAFNGFVNPVIYNPTNTYMSDAEKVFLYLNSPIAFQRRLLFVDPEFLIRL